MRWPFFCAIHGSVATTIGAGSGRCGCRAMAPSDCHQKRWQHQRSCVQCVRIFNSLMTKMLRSTTITCAIALFGTLFAAHAAAQVDGTLVRHKGVTVDAGDLNEELGLLEQEKRQRIISEANELQSTVTGLYFRKRMSQLAESQGLLADAEVQAALRQAREATLAKLMTDRYLEDIDYPSFEEEARRYYEEHLSEFTPPERIRAAHIFLQAPKTEDKKRRRGEAEKILKRLRKGKSFSELAKKHSEDSTRHTGGDLGFFTRERMAPEFNEVAFSMKEKGAVSDVVETRFGLHIVKLLDRDLGEPNAFEAVSEQIKERLKAEYRRENFSAWLKQEVPPEVVRLPDARLQALQDALAERYAVRIPEAEASADAESTQVQSTEAAKP